MSNVAQNQQAIFSLLPFGIRATWSDFIIRGLLLVIKIVHFLFITFTILDHNVLYAGLYTNHMLYLYHRLIVICSLEGMMIVLCVCVHCGLFAMGMKYMQIETVKNVIYYGDTYPAKFRD